MYGGERLNEATDKSQDVKDYLGDYLGIIKAEGVSVEAKLLAAELIPRFFQYFPTLSEQAIDRHVALCKDEEIQVRLQAIPGLPLFCKNTPQYCSKLVDVLEKLRPAGENEEHDAVKDALMLISRQIVKKAGSEALMYIEEVLYMYGKRLREATEKSQDVNDYLGIIEAEGVSIKAKLLAAQLIPRFFKYFPTLSEQAIDRHVALCKDEEIQVRLQAIPGLPLFCKDTPQYCSKLVDVLEQLRPAGENEEHDVVNDALMLISRQIVKKARSEALMYIEEVLYMYGKRLREATEKSQDVKDYLGIIEAEGVSIKAKLLAAQLIPRFFKYFPTLSEQAIDRHVALCKDEEIQVRLQAIPGLPLFCKDTPQYCSKLVDVLEQLRPAGENEEHDAVNDALMLISRQIVKKAGSEALM